MSHAERIFQRDREIETSTTKVRIVQTQTTNHQPSIEGQIDLLLFGP